LASTNIGTIEEVVTIPLLSIALAVSVCMPCGTFFQVKLYGLV
jgi:hypothetical protein